MAIIYTETIETAEELKAAFAAAARDYYPLPVYQGLLDLIHETAPDAEPFHFNALAWACDMTETELDTEEFEDLEALEAYIADRAPVLWIDEEEGIIYHLAY